MKLNDRVRKHLADQLLPGETIVATIALNNQIGTPTANSSGSISGGSSALGTPYAVRMGIDLNDPWLRHQLLASWCTLTETRMLFHKPKASAIRPTPGDLIEEHSRDGVRLSWFDNKGYALDNRVFHFDFPDGTRVLSAAILKAKLRRKPYNDEPFLLVRAFGDHATEVSND